MEKEKDPSIRKLCHRLQSSILQGHEESAELFVLVQLYVLDPVHGCQQSWSSSVYLVLQSPEQCWQHQLDATGSELPHDPTGGIFGGLTHLQEKNTGKEGERAPRGRGRGGTDHESRQRHGCRHEHGALTTKGKHQAENEAPKHRLHLGNHADMIWQHLPRSDKAMP